MPEPRAEEERPDWSVRALGHPDRLVRGLAFGGDWMSPSHLAELLSGEDEDRVTRADVLRLLDIIEKGLADG